MQQASLRPNNDLCSHGIIANFLVNLFLNCKQIFPPGLASISIAAFIPRDDHIIVKRRWHQTAIRQIYLKVVVVRDIIYSVKNQIYVLLLASSCDLTISHISLILTSRNTTPSHNSAKQSATYAETAITLLAHSYEIILNGLVILHFTALYIATLIALTKLRLLPHIVCSSHITFFQSLQGLVSSTIQYFPNPYKYYAITRLIAFATNQHTLGVRYDSPILWMIIPIGASVTTVCTAIGLAGMYVLINSMNSHLYRIFPKTEIRQPPLGELRRLTPYALPWPLPKGIASRIKKQILARWMGTHLSPAVGGPKCQGHHGTSQINTHV